MIGLATALAACGPTRRPTPPVPEGVVAMPAATLPRARGLTLRRQLTTQSVVALSAGSGPRKDAPDLRVTLGFQYFF